MIDRFRHFSLDIFQISHYWNYLVAEEMKKYGMKGTSILYLLALYREEEGMTAAQLSNVCQRDKADVSRSVAALKKQGLIAPGDGNRYRSVLTLTEEGRALASRLEDRAKLALDLAGEGISEEKREIMYECLDRIADRLKELSEEGLPEIQLSLESPASTGGGL